MSDSSTWREIAAESRAAQRRAILPSAVRYLEGTMVFMLRGDDGVYRLSTDGWSSAS